MARAASRDVVIVGSRRKAKLEAIVRRASSHASWPNAQIAARLGCTVTTVRTWRRRYARGGLLALCDRPRSGRPEVHGPDVRLRIVATVSVVT